MVSPSAVKVTFDVASATAIGVKRTVTAWLAPSPTRENGLPATMRKGPEVDAAPETVPPPVFDTVNVRSAKPPRFTSSKSTVAVGLTPKWIRATPLAESEQALSAPLEFSAVTATV